MTSLTPSLDELTAALRQAWNAETGYANVGVWNPENPARGQCVTSSLVVQDYFGGDLVRYEVHGENISEKHYANLLDNKSVIDTTKSQYTIPVTIALSPVNLRQYSSAREKLLADEETWERYLLLKSRVDSILSENSR